jgi:hypothetical protein
MVSKPPDFLKIHHPTNIDLDQHLGLEDFKRSQSAKRNLMAGDLGGEVELEPVLERVAPPFGMPSVSCCCRWGGPLHAELKNR